MAELAHAYVSLRISTQGMGQDVKKALTGIEGDAGKTGRSMGQKLSSGMGSVLKKSAIGVGVASGAALAAGLTKGVGRLNSIEQAESKLSGLGNSASNVGGIMENALASVKGTSYGLEEAATIAASAVAAGVKPGQDLERTLKLTGDAAAIAGTDLSSMGSIINKVATSDMMQMDVANQLMDAGIPILQMVGKELGVTAEEARKMASAGEVSFETFQNALEQGVGGAALKMGDTTQGAFKNMGAAAGRLGATLAGPFFTQAGGAFRGITDLLDDLNDKAGPAMDRLATWLPVVGAAAATAFKQFAQSDFAATAMSDLGRLVGSLGDVAADVWPSLVKIGSALAEASAALGVSAWSAFVAALEVGASVLGALTGPLETVASVMESQPHLVTAAVAAWLAFRTVPMVIGGVGTAVDSMRTRLAPAVAGVRNFGGAWQDSMRWAGQAHPQLSSAGQAVHVLGQNAKSAASSGLSSLTNALGGPLNIAIMAVGLGLAGLAAESQRAKQHQDALRSSSEGLVDAQASMADALVESEGSVNAEVYTTGAAAVRELASGMREVGDTGVGFMSGLGVATKSAAQLYGAVKTGSLDMAQNAVETVKAAWAQDDLADKSAGAAQALSDLGMTNDMLSAAVFGSAGAWGTVRAQLTGMGEDGQFAAGQLQGMRDEFLQQQAMVEAVGPGFYTMRDALDVLADSAASADQKLSSMRVVLEQLGIIQTSADEKIANVAASVDKLGESLDGTNFAADEFGRVFQNADGSLNLMNTNTHSLNDSLTGMRDELMGVVTSGGDAMGVFQEMQPELEAMRSKAEAAGLDWQGLLNTQGMTPEKIATMIELNGVEESQVDLLAIGNKLSEVKLGAHVPVEIRGGQPAVDELARLGIKVHEFDATTGSATVSVENQGALNRIMNTQGLLGRLDNTTSISDILAVNGDAQGKIWQTQGGLNNLDATNPLSSILAENGQAQGAIGETQGGLDHLGNTHPNSNITADNSQAGSAISQVNTWLANIPPTKAVRVVFNAVYQGFRSALGMGDNSTGGAWDGGKALPRFAGGGHNGYRLPTSGPGTETTDGFTAFDRNMIPAARLDAGEWIINGRSSEKYNKELAAINAGVFPKLPGYAEGGRADAKELLDFVHNRTNSGQSRSLEGAPYVFGGINWGDCSSAMTAIARFAVGLAPFAERFTTMTEREGLLGLGFKLGLGGEGDLRMGWLNGGPGGGHTAGTLPDGTNVEMGGGRGNGQIGGPAAGASHPQFTDHAHLPIHTWQFAGMEGWDSLMPPGAIGYTPDSMFESSPGLYESPGNSGQVSDSQPKTWSDMAAGAVSQLVGGQVSDVLGVFGVPDQLPPIIQAWQMLNEKPGGGPSDWDLSTTAAEVKRLDAAVQVRQQFVDEAARGLDALNNSGVGNALPAQVMEAETALDGQLLALERDQLEYERAQGRLEELLGARAAAVATKDLKADGGDAQSLSEALSQPPGMGIPDEIMRDLKVDYNPDAGAEQWRPLVEKLLVEKGQPLEYADAVIARMDQESSGNPRAQNNDDSNAAAGTPSKGLMQPIDPTFQAFKDPGFDDIWDPEANIRASMNYVLRDPKFKGRSMRDVYSQAGGYNLGGWIAGQGTKDSVPLVGAPGEFIVNRRAAAENREQLEAMNSGKSVRGGGPQVTYNIQTFSLDEAMRELSRKEAQHAQTFMGAR